jgi:hypothetical protein
VIQITANTTLSDFSNVPSISVHDVNGAIRRLRSLKSLGLDENPGYIIKGCSDIFDQFI